MENFTTQASPNEADYIYNTSVFGGFKRIIQSKNFQGGEINLLFGEVELDLSYADMNAPVVIDITQGFGTVKLYVPSNWRVVDQSNHFLSNLRDKTFFAGAPVNNNDKVLILRGFSFLAEIKVLPARFANY